MSKPELDAIRARVEAATEGPWDWASAPAEGSNETAAEYLEKALTDDGPLFVVWVPATQGASEGYRLAASTGDGPHASMDAEFIANARQDIPNLLALIDELERWKVEALGVMVGLQELGQALGLPLGAKVTGTQAVERAKYLTAQIEQLETLLDEVRALAGPDNESGMISASAIFHTIGTGNQGDDECTKSADPQLQNRQDGVSVEGEEDTTTRQTTGAANRGVSAQSYYRATAEYLGLPESLIVEGLKALGGDGE